MKLPKEIASYLLQQVEETKNGLFRVVAKEIRDFLEHTNTRGEMQKMLTTVQFEINTTIRFKPNDSLRPDGDAEEGPAEDGARLAEARGEDAGSRQARGPRPRRRARE